MAKKYPNRMRVYRVQERISNGSFQVILNPTENAAQYLRQLMREYVVRFVYITSKGNVRESWGTLVKDWLPPFRQQVADEHRAKDYADFLTYYDVDLGEWRTATAKNIYGYFTLMKRPRPRPQGEGSHLAPMRFDWVEEDDIINGNINNN